MIFADELGREVRLGRQISFGSEGQILEVNGEPHLVAKVYWNPTEDSKSKLEAMQRNPPPAPGGTTGHVFICWPQRLLFKSGAGVGFLMPRVDISRSYQLFKLYSYEERVACLPGFTWAYLMRAGANLASVVAAVHARGYVIGDLNESNVFVTRSALVQLVSCDSWQVPAPHGGYFRCTVGTTGFRAPELQGRDLSKIDRTPAHDRFALGVLLFHMLMEGIHPFDGVWKDTAGEEPSTGMKIKEGCCPYTGSPRIDPPPNALPLDILPAELRSLFVRCFSAGGRGREGAEARPTAQEWLAALSDSQRKLRACSRNSQHVYGAHNETCPWCERALKFGARDLFPPIPVRPSQRSPLPDAQRGASVVGRAIYPQARKPVDRAYVTQAMPAAQAAAPPVTTSSITARRALGCGVVVVGITLLSIGGLALLPQALHAPLESSQPHPAPPVMGSMAKSPRYTFPRVAGTWSPEKRGCGHNSVTYSVEEDDNDDRTTISEGNKKLGRALTAGDGRVVVHGQHEWEFRPYGERMRVTKDGVTTTMIRCDRGPDQ